MVQSLDDARRRSRTGSTGRVPPHNLQAEESLLGAMLLSRDAIASAVEMCGVDDFYKPAHGHVFDAICSLYAQGEPADPVTVADELRRADLLEAIGGTGTLISLQANTPATANAGRYARIVEEHALLRRLIGVAGEIAEIGYGMPDDVAQAVDRAESMVFEVAERRVTDTLRPLHDLLSDSLDRLEALYDRGEAITGVPTGFLDLDERLSGLQPSNLLIVGARPSMGKALSLATRLPTPAGWTTIGDVRVGDAILDERGVPCSVTYVTPVMTGRPCYRVSFDDGSHLIADADHQWLAYDLAASKSKRERDGHGISDHPRNPNLAQDQHSRRELSRIVTTRQMLDEGVRIGQDQRPNWYISLAGPLDLPEQALPLDPYLLGVWLGDGPSARPSATTAAPEIVTSLSERGCRIQARTPAGAATTSSIGQTLVDPGVPTNKHIPRRYLRASHQQRRALLQGLMDTDGTVANSNGTVELCLSHAPLLAQARELVCSLGHKPGPIHLRTIERPGRTCFAWQFTWTPVDEVSRLRRKSERLAATKSHRRNGRHTRRAIVSIEPCASVPVRCLTVDSPNHLYLAGDSMIPTHNTALALGMAAHAAMEARTPVLFFSLEMSHSEVTQRLLCSEARVDSSRIRNGKLLESDWPKISHAIGRLGEAPLYIDDNPNLTVMEIRAKARRLRSRLGELGLIIVDYLQLMTGRNSAENRQVEVSEISRGLKILARELEVPVVALSQLSRNLEQRADKRPMLADLRESGCMPATTRIMRADNGQEVTLGELVLSQEQPLVWSLNEQLRLTPQRLVRTFPSGVRPVLRIVLKSGRTVDATANHRFRTAAGWSRLDQLQCGDSIAVPRRLPPPVEPAEPWDEDELVLLAHLLGGGSMGLNGVRYAAADRASKEIVQQTALRRFGITATATLQGNTWRVTLPSPYRLTHGRHHPVRNWLEPLGLWGSRADDKFVPQEVFGLADDQIALFLHHLWATRGAVTVRSNRTGRNVTVHYASKSRQIAEDVRRLLLRLDIRSTIRRSRKNVSRDSWRVMLTGGSMDKSRFLRIVGCYGKRGECDDALEILATVKPKHPVDFPTSDVLWDEILEIIPLGNMPTFDATIDGTHNFLADGIVAHNSLEQDADVVMFLYRDEVYNPESPDRGTAEIIVSKHRNGPTGITQLAFLDHYTRFANMARV